MKKYVLIAGVNGAGKSTLYQTLSGIKNMPRVNTDEILKSFGDWKSLEDTVKAGKIAIGLIDRYFAEGRSFNQETTLCGRAALKNIRTAKEKGYFVEMHYVGVDSAETAKKRVRMRVARGGHGIAESDIERRYIESFKNLKLILGECDMTAFYENTDKFRRFAIFKGGEPVVLSKTLPEWFQRCGVISDAQEG